MADAKGMAATLRPRLSAFVGNVRKRPDKGSCYKLWVMHMYAYSDEQEWQFNNRENKYLFRDTLINLLNAETLPYQELKAS